MRPPEDPITRVVRRSSSACRARRPAPSARTTSAPPSPVPEQFYGDERRRGGPVPRRPPVVGPVPGPGPEGPRRRSRCGTASTRGWPRPAWRRRAPATAWPGSTFFPQSATRRDGSGRASTRSSAPSGTRRRTKWTAAARLLVGAGPLGPHPPADRSGAGAVPGDGGGATGRPALPRLGRGRRVLRPPRAGRRARDRKRTTTAFQDTYDLFSRRLEGGAASALETARAEASLGQVSARCRRSSAPSWRRRTSSTSSSAATRSRFRATARRRRFRPTFPGGLPSALLERRPDVRQAEQLLVAANAGIGVAKANFFPTLNLTGLFGNVSPELGQILSSNGQAWDFKAGLLGPIFAAGRLKKNYQAALARPRPGGGPVRGRRHERPRRGVRSAGRSGQARRDGEAAGAARPPRTGKPSVWRPSVTSPGSRPTSRCWTRSSSSTPPRSASPRPTATSFWPS